MHLLSYENDALQLTFGKRKITYNLNNLDNFRALLLDVLKQGKDKYRGKVARNIANALLLIFKEFVEHKNEFTWNTKEDIPGNIDSPLYLLAGKLITNDQNGVFEKAQRDSWVAVYVFSLVKIPKDLIGKADIPTPEQIQDERSKVITVAMHLFFGPGSSVAVEVAGKLLEQVMVFDR